MPVNRDEPLGEPRPRPFAQLLDEVRERLWTFTVYVFRVDGAQPDYRGTASCVATEGASYLLTAAHVWNALQGDTFALGLKEDRLLTAVEKQVVSPSLLSAGPPYEWGPDLALIRLPQPAAWEISQEKAFYNLDRERPEPGAAAERDNFWALVGAPAEQAVFSPTESILRLCLFDSWTSPRECQRGGLDYRDLALDHTRRKGLPQSYGGISGSGLWRIPITRSGDQISWRHSVRLEGVAFFQVPMAGPQQVIRCHGPKSILLCLQSGSQ
jgi:hypothetical protein